MAGYRSAPIATLTRTKFTSFDQISKADLRWGPTSPLIYTSGTSVAGETPTEDCQLTANLGYGLRFRRSGRGFCQNPQVCWLFEPLIAGQNVHHNRKRGRLDGAADEGLGERGGNLCGSDQRYSPQILLEPISKNLRQHVLMTAELTLVGTLYVEHSKNIRVANPAILSDQRNLTMDSLPTGSTQSWLIVATVAFSPAIALFLADAIGWLIRQARGKGGVTALGQTASRVRQSAVLGLGRWGRSLVRSSH